MNWVIYNKRTTILAGKNGGYATARAAQAGLTRLANNDKIDNRDDYDIAPADEFRKNIEQHVERLNIMSGTTYMEPINTPGYMSPASEAYWSM